MGIGQRHSHIMKPKKGPDDPELATMLQEALTLVSIADLLRIADELVARHRWFVARFAAPPAPGSLAPDDLTRFARSVTTSKRDATSLSQHLLQHQHGQHGQHGQSNTEAMFAALLNHERPVGRRIAEAVAALSGKNGLDERICLEAATGLLHFTAPDSYWWWTRWLWDATMQTGILSLLAGSVHNVRASTIGEGYKKVGSVTAMSMRFAEGTGLLVPELVNDPQRVRFASDVFLACAYVVYMYGISSWRLSREFNRLLPAPPAMMRRLLGVPRPRDKTEGMKPIEGGACADSEKA